MLQNLLDHPMTAYLGKNKVGFLGFFFFFNLHILNFLLRTLGTYLIKSHIFNTT